jgi:hypothetical protein
MRGTNDMTQPNKPGHGILARITWAFLVWFCVALSMTLTIVLAFWGYLTIAPILLDLWQGD